MKRMHVGLGLSVLVMAAAGLWLIRGDSLGLKASLVPVKTLVSHQTAIDIPAMDDKYQRAMANRVNEGNDSETAVYPVATAIQLEDIRSKLTERYGKYSWSDKIRAVYAAELKETDQKLGGFAGFQVVLKSGIENQGLLLVGRGEKKELAVYSGQIVIVTGDKSFVDYLNTRNLKYTQLGESYFVQEESFRGALGLLEEIAEKFPSSLHDVDWVSTRYIPM